MKQNQKKKRYEKLDGVRGIALLHMIAYHMIWDLVYIYQLDWNWYQSNHCISGRCGDHASDVGGDAAEQSCLWRADAHRLLYAVDAGV